MTNEQILVLVYEMRKAQKLYFKTRNKKILEDSKQLEKEVDEELQNQLFSHQLNLLTED